MPLKAEATFTIRHAAGLHARPLALFVQTTKKFQSAIKIRNATRGGAAVDAKSILSVLTLGVQQGHDIHLEAEGPDAEAALAAVAALVHTNFGEE